jgi:hypothetical protein
MLALDDAALARFAIAATRIAPEQREQWLQEIAAKLDPPTIPTVVAQRARTPAARRQARVRERRKNGVHVYRQELSDRAVEGLIMKFILEGKLSEAQALEHRCIEHAIAAFLEEEGFRWSR